jgi:predicted phosphodiesterase
MKKINKILLVSDSHGDLNNFERILKLEKPDYVIHAGDYDNWGLGKGKDVIIPKNYIKKNFNQSILGNHGCSIISKSHPEFIEKYKNDYKIFNLLGKKVMLTHSFELLDESHRKNYGE